MTQRQLWRRAMVGLANRRVSTRVSGDEVLLAATWGNEAGSIVKIIELLTGIVIEYTH